jgi:predicted PurR-regulated permease PerM
MIKFFLLPIVLAAVITTLFFPFYNSLLRRVRNRKNIASFLCCFILLIVFLLPLFLVIQIVAGEAAQFYQSAGEKIKTWLQPGRPEWLIKIEQHP